MLRNDSQSVDADLKSPRHAWLAVKPDIAANLELLDLAGSLKVCISHCYLDDDHSADLQAHTAHNMKGTRPSPLVTSHPASARTANQDGALTSNDRSSAASERMPTASVASSGSAIRYSITLPDDDYTRRILSTPPSTSRSTRSERCYLDYFTNADTGTYVAIPPAQREFLSMKPFDLESRIGSPLDWMAEQQGCAVPAMPVHTADEIRLIRRIVDDATAAYSSAEWARQFNEHVNKDANKGLNLFYKLPEHIDAYSKPPKGSSRKRRHSDRSSNTSSLESAPPSSSLSSVTSSSYSLTLLPAPLTSISASSIESGMTTPPYADMPSDVNISGQMTTETTTAIPAVSSSGVPSMQAMTAAMMAAAVATSAWTMPPPADASTIEPLMMPDLNEPAHPRQRKKKRCKACAWAGEPHRALLCPGRSGGPCPNKHPAEKCAKQSNASAKNNTTINR